MKILIASLMVFFSFSIALAGGGYLLVKSEKDLGESRGELFEMFDKKLVGFLHESNEFVLECDGECESLVKKLKTKEGYKVKEISEEEYKKLMNR